MTELKALDKLFTEQGVEDVAEKIISSIRDKIKDQIANEFYDRMHNYLYEHYDNFKDELEKDLIKEITEQFVANPSSYRFKELRDKLFIENKDKILSELTEEAIRVNVEVIILKYTHKNYTFDWMWKEGIVSVILSNWDKFKDDDRIHQSFGREIDGLKSWNKQLQDRLDKIEIEP